MIYILIDRIALFVVSIGMVSVLMVPFVLAALVVVQIIG